MKVTYNGKRVDFLLVDADHVAYRAYHAFQKQPLVTSTGEDVGVQFGFLNAVRAKLVAYNPGKTILCWGGPRSSLWRRVLFPEYKMNREPTPPEIIDQFQWLRELLTDLGFQQLTSTVDEADDLLAYTLGVIQRQSPQAKVVILTSDHDMKQLVSPTVTLVSPSLTGPDLEFDLAAVKAQYAVDPALLPDLFALLGDDADNVEGVKGIGLVTGSRLVGQYGRLEDWLFRVCSLDLPERVREALIQRAGRVLFNKYLFVLDPNRKKVGFINLPGKPIPDVVELCRLFDRLEFRKITPFDFLTYTRREVLRDYYTQGSRVRETESPGPGL